VWSHGESPLPLPITAVFDEFPDPRQETANKLHRLTRGQLAVPDGSHEIGVIPALLRALELAGALVTIDAAGCQVANARLIREQGGH
jgi:hypothetical protein